ncbi:DUF1489 family protein [Croceicoccus sp. YJ47]|uniref:DUF1489 family protein n=1 Tax=Croceicoccus sp. YJ47 TaxID=2798724 RepID=UPI001924698D|nr:DUF1489 family protein [Croceicoccus sp. YJ47]QQN74511.1 DUF1489 domain-containing protein [Croceicoccus sp. YJ47]
MPLNMTKIAFRANGVDGLRQRIAAHEAEFRINTRYIPKRHEEMIGGSLYWIVDHAIVGRSEIRAFEKREDGRYDIVLAPELIAVETRPKRAHQGWRYLEEADAPRDLPEGADPGDVLPGRLLNRLTKLGLV